MSLLLYYLLVSSLTNLAFSAFGTIIFLLVSQTSKIDTILIVIILFVLLQKSLIVGYVTHLAHKQARFDKVSGTRFIGIYFGRFFGLIIGAFGTGAGVFIIKVIFHR